MAARHQTSHFPPSPPPSPPRRRHIKKRSDPLCDLDAPLPSPTASSNEAPEAQDSLLTRIILTPLLFTSFLLSLFLINRSDRARRTRQSATLPQSLFAYLSPTAWLDPEPYQDPTNTTWERRGSVAHVEPHSVLGPAHNQMQPNEKRTGQEGKWGKRGWHLHKKIRKVARLEIDDAFALRRHIIVVILCALVLSVVGLWMGAGRVKLTTVSSHTNGASHQHQGAVYRYTAPHTTQRQTFLRMTRLAGCPAMLGCGLSRLNMNIEGHHKKRVSLSKRPGTGPAQEH
ncbi:hypothetical protein K491DRAFT_678934 [Lophiostoma macrostomum CBS 122681]|uniref:Uncharacterized protein n=1 Tax=Lophiostoma macrostomum CBS 122681 TaxID=1314788 RepID=A0A6A6T5R6_9PLEO|nr:hypothetical protein K491DRAFT_678934 [Lophiostoma macrostomum CBS 122681]